jgi:cytoskeletal protein RodZ
MPLIGEKLRRRRLESGISLDQVATQTKIGTRLLEAIEAEQFERLPGGVFRRKFVVQYARALGFDEQDIAGELQQLSQFDAPPSFPRQEIPRFGSDRKPIAMSRDWSGVARSFGSLTAVVAVILGCAGLYMWWQQVADRKPVPETAAAASAPAPQNANPPASPIPPAAGTSSGSQPVRVGIVAGEATWVQAHSDGKRVYSNKMKANEAQVIQAAESIRLLVGNAGGIEVSFNGKPIPPIGPRGQVRTVEFTPTGYQIVQRKPPNAEPL